MSGVLSDIAAHVCGVSPIILECAREVANVRESRRHSNVRQRTVPRVARRRGDAASQQIALRSFRVCRSAQREVPRDRPGKLSQAPQDGSCFPATHLDRRLGKALTGIIVSTQGALSELGANQLRPSLAGINRSTMAQPKAYVTGVRRTFDDGGGIAPPITCASAVAFLGAFEQLARRQSAPLAARGHAA